MSKKGIDLADVGILVILGILIVWTFIELINQGG